jgi:hypothetical protein
MMTTAAEEPIAAAAEDLELEPATAIEKEERPIHLAKCSECSAAVRFRPTSSGAGFAVLERIGVSDDTNFGVGASGGPLCPNGHGEMHLADEQLPVEEAFALAQEQLRETRPPRLPFPAPPFNYEGALHEIFEKQSEITRLEIKFNDADERRKKAKASLDEAREELGKMIDVIREREEDRLAELQRRQDNIDAGHPEDTNLVRCRWEEQHPGETCPMCTSDLPTVAARDSVLHIDEVVELLDVRSVTEVRDALEDGGIFVIESVVRAWTTEQRAEVVAWAAPLLGLSDEERIEALAKRPSVLGTGHIAADVADGAEAQCCQVCGAVVLALGEGEIVGVDTYTPGSVVGVDCAGQAAADGQHYIGGQRKKKRARKTAAE